MPWYGYAIISALSIAVVGLLQKKTLQYEHSLEYAAVFTGLKILLIFAVFGTVIEWSLPAGMWRWVVMAGLLYAMAFLSVTKSMRRMDLSTVMPVLATEPALVAVLALFLLGETLTLRHVIGLGFTLIGTYVLELRRHTDQTHTFLQPFRQLVAHRGGRLALWGLGFFSFSSVLDRYVLQRVDVVPYILYILLISLVIYTGMWIYKREPFTLHRVDHRWLLPLMLLIAGLHLTSNMTQAKAVSLAAVGLVIAVKRTAALLDVVIGGRLFHERHLVQKILASIIILTGVYFIVTP